MSYTVYNYKTKKALKEAVAKYVAKDKSLGYIPIVRCYQPGLGPDLSNFTGKVYLEGPHYPKAHTWYAEAQLKNGIVVKVS